MKLICKKWRSKLQIEKLPIVFDYIEQPFNSVSMRKGILYWNFEEKSWHIELYQLADKRVVIHELGHIYLAKILNNWFFVASCKIPNQRFRKMNKEIERFLNRLIDCFVDYKLSKFEGFYTAFVVYVNSDLKDHPNPQIYESKDFVFYYLKAYIDLCHILKPEDQNAFNSEIKSYLIKIKNFVIKKVREEKNRLSFRFQNLDQQLDKFNEIRESLEPKILVNFMYDTLKMLGLWSKEELYSNFKLNFDIYPIK